MQSTLFFVIITTISTFITLIPPCFCQPGYQYITCGAWFHCANIQNMGYPFWGLNRPDYCGRNAFQLTNCRGDVAVITIGSISYRVLSMDKQTRSLTLARSDFFNNNCPTSLINTTLDPTHFISSSTNQLLILYYGCTTGQFNCTVNQTQSVSYFRSNVGPISDDVASCRSSASVLVNGKWGPVLGSNSASMSDLQAALASGFGVEWRNDSLCDRCKDSGGRCGSETKSDSFACYCADSSVYGPVGTICNTTTQYVFSEQHLKEFSITGGVITIIILIIFILYYRRRRFKAEKNEQMNDENVEAFFMNYGSLAPKRYSYNDIKKVTNSFADKLGEGGYGSVFKGKLIDGTLVAVKVLNDADGDGGNFVNEVASISRTSHVNIVTLLGFCLERNKRALIYEFMPNKSLDKFICGSSSLDWETLYKIAVGTARGLEYLHRGCNTRIVHFDIKPENILLDEEFCPKISDFGMAKLCPRKKSILTMIGARGTPGYIAPEVFCRNFGEVSHKSDVYSYGMMVINMVGVGQNNEVGSRLDSTESEMYFPNFIYKRLERGEDPLGSQGFIGEEGEKTARKMILVGLWCIQPNPLDRPSMSKVVEMLEGNIELIQVPPKPFLFSPSKANQDSCLSLSSDEETQLIESSSMAFSSRKTKSEWHSLSLTSVTKSHFC